MTKIKMIKDWKKHFQDVSDLHRFTLDMPGGNLNKDAIKYHEVKFNQELYSRLRNFCQENDYSLFSVFFTAWVVLFSRYIGQNDSVIGLYRPQIEGLESDVIPIISHLETHELFVDALKKNVEFFKTTEYQLVTISEIFETLNIDPNQKHHPLYQTQFSFYESNVKPAPSSSLSAVPLDFELKISCSADDCSVGVTYSSGIINSSTIKNILMSFERLIESIIKAPNSEISSLDMVPSAQRNKILIDWNDTAHEYPKDKTIYQLFEEQVEKTPDNLAVLYEEKQLSYRELNEQSNQLAHFLRTQGVGPEIMVVVACERSHEMIVAIMGILKAGGAFISIDPSYPRERIEYMLDDTKAPIILTQSWVKEKLPATGGRIVELDHMDEFCGEYPVGNLEALSGPDNLVYVIYTSGSTGKPKGVMIEHKNLMNFISWFKDIIPPSEKKGSLIHSPIVFDMPIPSLFHPLITANYIHIIPQKHDPESLIEGFKKNDDYSFIKITPSHVKLIENRYDLSTLKDLSNCFIIAGEELKYDYIASWLKLNPQILLINEYGPTEATVGCTFYQATEKDQERNTIPIGKPIWNTSLYILDETLNPVPIGVIGELYIAGDGVVRGYLNRPELTTERFIPNPFMTEEDCVKNHNERLYKTGDLCRYLEDGNIDYIGRIDHQVKIRGFRVETGEIETILLSNPAIQEVAAVVREDETDNKQLVVYYVAKPGAVIESGILRDSLKSSLPNYMIPSFFVSLKTMPLSPSGKLDRKALPIPEIPENRHEYVAPRTQTEEVLAEIWQDILHIDHVGVNDNFFEMGGDSLKATRVISRIRQQNNVEIPYRYFFENPIIASLANYLKNNTVDTYIPPLIPVSREQNIPISFNQQSLLLEEIYVSNLIYVIRLEGDLDYSAFEESLNLIVQRHEALRSTVILQKNNQDLAIQKIDQQLHIKINHIDLTRYSEKEQQKKIDVFIDNDKRKSFYIDTAPLFRFHLIKKNKSDHLFVFTIHHIFFDLESLGILFNEISRVYNAKVLGTQPELPPLPIQWADYSLWQWEYLKGHKLEEHLSYWIDNLKTLPIELELPIDYPRKTKNVHEVITYMKRLKLISKLTKYFLKWEVVSRILLRPYFEGAQHSFEIPGSVAMALKKVSEEQNVTLYMTLLAAFNVLIHGYNSQEDIVIGTPFSTRNRIETEELIGYFVNFLPMRINLKGKPTFSQLLKQVKNITLKAYDYPYVPWIQIMEQAKKQEDSILLNVGRLMFSLEQNLTNNLSLEGISSKKEDYDNSFCECELILIIVENGDGLSGCFKYRTNLFKKETIEEMCKRFLSLLEEIIRNPEADINQLRGIFDPPN